MPRYKTVGFSQCERRHFNVFDIRLVAESAERARTLSILDAAQAKCMHCDSTLLRVVRVEPTQEISFHIEYTIYGYTCDCGEKVEVARVEKERTLTPPSSKTVKCSKGHSRTISNNEFPFLQVWTEKTN